KKKKKFLQKEELRKLISSLDLSPEISIDWFILIIAKTGLRYAEALALTPADFDWSARTLRVNKTWNYKSTQGGFKSTKTTSSERTISIDFQIVGQFQLVIKDLPANEPIFVEKF
ncbi:tyrosine-type recombinase/integrase, partial [Klebsiella grimontii]